MKNTIFPRVEVEATFFAVTLDGVELGTFSAFQIHQGYVYSSSVETGDIVTVHLHDENGMPIEKIGEVMEVLS